MRFKFEQAVFFPVVAVFRSDVKVAVFDVVGRALNLDVATRTERHNFTFRDLEFEFFDEGRFVVVGDDGAFPFFDAKDGFVHFDFHVALYRNLAGQAFALACFALADVVKLNRQDFATAFVYFDDALAAATAAATSG